MGDKLEVSESNPLFFMIMKAQIDKKIHSSLGR